MAKKYQIIYADPPWMINKIKRKVRPNQVNMDYPMMTISEIESLPIKDISEDNSVCFMWTIQKYLESSFNVMRQWGFKPLLTITWDKGNGLCLFGFHWRTEFLLFGYRGKIGMYPQQKVLPTIIQAKSNRHSEKPEIFRELISRFGERKIELFARQKTDGWDVWGNEVESDIIL